jgi:hypothetical protein
MKGTTDSVTTVRHIRLSQNLIEIDGRTGKRKYNQYIKKDADDLPRELLE